MATELEVNYCVDNVGSASVRRGPSLCLRGCASFSTEVFQTRSQFYRVDSVDLAWVEEGSLCLRGRVAFSTEVFQTRTRSR